MPYEFDYSLAEQGVRVFQVENANRQALSMKKYYGGVRMDSKTKLKTMIAKFLIGVMMFTLLPGNVWAEAQETHDEKTG